MTLRKGGQLKQVINFLDALDQENTKTNSDTYIYLLQQCINLKALREGKRVHAHILKWGFEPNIFLGNTLVNMYSKCGSVVDARQVFEKMPERNLYTWTIMITGYAQHGQGKEAIELFQQMERLDVKPDKATFMSILKACTGIAALEQGKQIHKRIIKSRFESDIFVGSALVDMYAKCGSIENARHVFDNMPKRDVVSWNAMIGGYAQRGQCKEALDLFQQLEWESMKPDKVTFVNIIKACASVAALKEGTQIHAHVIKMGFEGDVFVGSTLVDMYAKCGSIELARRVFDEMPNRNVVSWNAMIGGYAQHGQGEEALDLYWQMQQEGVKAVKVTFMSIIKACASIAALEQGKEIHAHIIKNGFESDVILGSTLVDMYAKCGSIEHARQVFDKLPKRDVVLWTAMISGYSQHGQAKEALELFQKMEQEGIKPDSVTFVSILKVCASVAALERGKQIHARIIKSGFESDIIVGNTLVDMYAKCGSLEHARQVFSAMPKRDVASWNSMISAYAQHGYGKEALQLVEKMRQEEMKLDHITFVCILSACSHAGLLDEGRDYFHSMSRDHGITPTDEHYACMVDLLGRAGQLEEAENLIKRMPLEPSAVVWRTLLGACRIHGNVKVAKRATECILELEPQNLATHVLLSNLYAAAGMWNDRTRVRNTMEDEGVKKLPGFSYIEVSDQVDAFFIEDTGHPQMNEIEAELKRVSRQMEDAGYIPDTCLVLHGLKVEQKETSISYHSEKLAIAFGIINTPPATLIRIVKNPQVCGDCHTDTKFISKIAGRDIVVRDANHSHHFKDGVCSCGN